MSRIKEFLQKLLSIKVWTFTGVFIFSAFMLIDGKLSGGEYVTLALGLCGMLWGAREYSKQQTRNYIYATQVGVEEDEEERKCGFRHSGERGE
jgi:hypothetical protein